MKKLLILTALSAILFVGCDDTRKTLHEKYLEFVMHTDSLELVHDAMTVHNEALKSDTRTLKQRLQDLEDTDSLALLDLAKHQALLKEQNQMLAKLKEIINSHGEMKAYFMSDSISIEAMEARLQEMEANNEDIASRLSEIKAELVKIEDQQDSMNPLKSE
ncbi:hypothetical protein [Leeuwenhoekiella parthenopeia]|uniref:Lipoprotein n=1 Tax=Leeuwenhoekiella parthenopeia TaxID=2890320 RepID=A0ABS8GYM6_9FLAO|nr:hypothetical protein [Leeuwenhoekiella parthenopeia]MCC4214186.1 hypothetical protein [Leeuwenhoekiella parthenopeia]